MGIEEEALAARSTANPAGMGALVDSRLAGADRRWTIACAAIAALLAVALSWDFFTLPLDPWPDQAWALLAAERHHRGLGLTTTMDGGSLDLAVTDYHRLTYFPPGYPLIVSAMRTTGLPITTIVKVINGIALAAGFAGWMLLAGRQLSSRPARLIFAVALVLACNGTIPKGGTTDYVFWAVLPFWFLAMTAGAREGRRRWVFAGAALVSLLIGFRWAAVSLVPAGVALLLLSWVGSMRGRLSVAVLFGAIPTLVFAGISLINRALSGHRSSVLSYLPPGLQPQLLASYFPWENAFSRPLGLEPLLARIWRQLDPAMSQSGLELVFRLLVPVGLLAFLLAFSDARRAIGGSAGLFSRLVLLSYVFLVGMLALMTVRYNWPKVLWTYLEEPRYYLPFAPAIALVWFRVAETVRARAGRWIGAGLVMIALLYLGQAEVRWSLIRLREGDTNAALLARLRTIADQQERRSVVFDISVSPYLLWDSPAFAPRIYPDESSAMRLYASTPVDVWIVERLEETTAYSSDPDFDRKRRDALLRRFRARASWRSSDGHFRMYHAPAGSY